MTSDPNRLPLNALRVFEPVATHLSFTAAARELGVTTAAVSAQVKSLEADIGVPLFRRHTRAVALSQEGAELKARLVRDRIALRDCLIVTPEPELYRPLLREAAASILLATGQQSETAAEEESPETKAAAAPPQAAPAEVAATMSHDERRAA